MLYRITDGNNLLCGYDCMFNPTDNKRLQVSRLLTLSYLNSRARWFCEVQLTACWFCDGQFFFCVAVASLSAASAGSRPTSMVGLN